MIPAQHGVGSARALRASGLGPRSRTTGHDPVVLGDLVLDLDVQVGMRPAVAGHELPHALWTDHGRIEGRDVPDVVGGHELVDQLEPSAVPHGLDEQLDLSLVELGDAFHRAG